MRCSLSLVREGCDPDGDSRVPVQDRPALLLSIEEDLGITAGLQDRVVQIYGGAVYMDFDHTYMAAHGRGRWVGLQ